MKMLKRFYSWALPNVVFATIWSIGIFVPVPGFVGLGKFIIWVMLVLAILFLFLVPEDRKKELAEKSFSHGTKIGPYFEYSYDTVIVVALSFFNYPGYAGMYLVAVFFMYMATQETKSEKTPIFEGKNFDINSEGEIEEKGNEKNLS